jgi:hypothetical protein
MKLKIDNEAIAEEFLENSVVLGVVASVNDYTFCWKLNQEMGFDFKVNNEHEIQLNKKSRNYFFSVYEYAIPATSLVHIIYNNQYDGEYLLPEFKHLDYIWLIQGEILPQEEIKTLVQAVKSLSGVQMVLEIPIDQIKHKEHLIL